MGDKGDQKKHREKVRAYRPGDEFRDEDDDLTLDFGEFEEHIEWMRDHDRQFKTEFSKLLYQFSIAKHCFERIDADNNGKLTLREFTVGFEGHFDQLPAWVHGLSQEYESALENGTARMNFMQTHHMIDQ